MKVSIEVIGEEELMAALQELPEEIQRAVGEEITEIAIDGQTEIVLRMQQGPHSGSFYKRGSVTHQASAPGEAPAPDTGTLVGSIYVEQEGDLTATVGSRLAYAWWLEYGTEHMRPRPVWQPVAQEIEATFKDDLEAAIKRALA